MGARLGALAHGARSSPRRTRPPSSSSRLRADLGHQPALREVRCNGQPLGLAGADGASCLFSAAAGGEQDGTRDPGEAVRRPGTTADHRLVPPVEQASRAGTACSIVDAAPTGPVHDTAGQGTPQAGAPAERGTDAPPRRGAERLARGPATPARGAAAAATAGQVLAKPSSSPAQWSVLLWAVLTTELGVRW